MDYRELKAGDKVQVDCYTGLGTGGVETVTEIRTKYYDNGKPYNVIVVEGDQQFSTETGEAVTTPYAYYIAKKI